MFQDTYQRGEKCPGLEIKWFICFQYSSPLSENRSQDVKMAHVRAYRSFFHVGLAACLENL